MNARIRRTAAAAALLALTGGLGGTGAQAQVSTDPEDGRVISPPGAALIGYAGQTATPSFGQPANVLVRQDGRLLHYQLDAATGPHDIVSDAVTNDPELWDERYCQKPPNGWKADPTDPDEPGWMPGDPIPDAWKEKTYCRLFASPLVFLSEETLETEAYITMPDGTPKLQVTDPNRLNQTSYGFFCSVHVNMRGRVIVLPPSDG